MELTISQYACLYRSPECCAFLIRAGAEVDGVAKSVHGT